MLTRQVHCVTMPPMIPRLLTLQNFLSYGSTPQTIDFDDYNLICLSGRNGHGKSALLDAITWAAWGQARKTVGTNKPDDGLLRLGTKQMKVIFEFEVNGQRYRVRREYSRAQGKPQANLDVGVYDSDLQEFRSLTEKTIRRTQAVIEKVIGLDYETYVNSAFLRQGHANEFSQKSPKERKKILATILGVNRYDGLQSLALEKAREAVQQIRLLQELQVQDERALEQRDELVVKQKQAEQAREAIEKKWHTLRDQELALQKLQLARATDSQQITTIEKKMLERQRVLESQHQKMREEKVHAVHAAQGAVEQLRTQYEHAQSQEQRIAAELTQVRVQHVELQKQVKVAQTTIDKHQKIKQMFDKRRAFYGAYVPRAKWLFSQQEELSKKNALVHENESPSCPLCEQMLSAKRKQFLHTKLATQQRQLTHRYDRLHRVLRQLKEQLVEDHKVVALYDAAVAKVQTLSGQVKQLGARSTQLITQQEKAKQTQLDHKKEFDAAVVLCNKAKEIVATFEKHCATELSDDAELQKLRKEKQQALQAQGGDKEAQERLSGQIKKVNDEQTAVRKEQEQVVAQLSTLRTKLEQLAEKKKAFDERVKQINAREESKADYTSLATAWSKNGIQALLIEQAIPEIEQEANDLLARLSHNQAQVFIESQRDLKSGGVRETLDIKIADTMGVRPYEMFSGGEAFRIDFALRIAISKLLARRAGTALQVLIIDEGFGSQDEEGLQRLMQALYTVQEDFEKIIIVSHLPEFKENFPVHFVVNKGATGSHVSVEQRG